jgi:hypothetical protein
MDTTTLLIIILIDLYAPAKKKLPPYCPAEK